MKVVTCLPLQLSPFYTKFGRKNCHRRFDPTMTKEEILDTFEEAGQKSKSLPSEFFRHDKTEENFLSMSVKATEKKSVICTDCGLGFGSKTFLEFHMSVVHINPISDSNNSSSATKNQLERKRSVPTKDILPPKKASMKEYTCLICDKSFSQNSSLKKHIASVHENKDTHHL